MSSGAFALFGMFSFFSDNYCNIELSVNIVLSRSISDLLLLLTLFNRLILNIRDVRLSAFD